MPEVSPPSPQAAPLLTSAPRSDGRGTVPSRPSWCTATSSVRASAWVAPGAITVARAGGRQVCPLAKSVRCQEVDHHWARPQVEHVAVSQTDRVAGVDSELQLLQLVDHRRDRALVGAHVGDQVAVLADLRRHLAVLERVQQHNLPTQQRLRHPQRRGRVQQHVPQPVHRRRQRRQGDRGRGGGAGHRAGPTMAAARSLRTATALLIARLGRFQQVRGQHRCPGRVVLLVEWPYLAWDPQQQVD